MPNSALAIRQRQVRRHVLTQNPSEIIQQIQSPLGQTTDIVLVNGVEVWALQYCCQNRMRRRTVPNNKKLTFLAKTRGTDNSYRLTVYLNCSNEIFDIFKNKQWERMAEFSKELKNITYA